MWRPGRRLFTVACILILITAVLHTIGSMAARENPAEQVMKETHLAMGLGMEPSFHDLFRDLALTMTVTFVALGVIGLVLAGSKSVSSVVIRDMTWLYLVWNGAFTALCYYYRVAPPLMCGVIVELTLVAALLLPGKSTEDVAAVRV